MSNKVIIVSNANELVRVKPERVAGLVFHNIVDWMLYHDIPPVMVVDEETGDTTKLKETDIH